MMLLETPDHFVAEPAESNENPAADRPAGGMSEAGALTRLEAACDGFLELGKRTSRSPVWLLHATAAALHELAATILVCEELGLDRASLLARLDPVRTLHAGSPFVKRLQTWPRGYPGDFETVEFLCDARNTAPAGTIGWAIEEYALQSPIAQQHRNKVGLQARVMLSAVLDNPEARIASIGCGGCRDLLLVQNYIRSMGGRFVLVDADADALAFARHRLDGIAGRCRFVHGRVPKVLSSLASGGPFDVVVAGGLFDYLPDRWAIATLRAVHRMLARGGRLLFSNIAAANPFRVWLEYLAEWRLIERQESDLRRLLAEAGFSPDDARIFRDSSGLAVIVDCCAGNSPDLRSSPQQAGQRFSLN
jgi:SAM-dependent methyltransferase